MRCSLFLIKKKVFSCEICEIFKNNCFLEHLRTIACETIKRLYLELGNTLWLLRNFRWSTFVLAKLGHPSSSFVYWYHLYDFKNVKNNHWGELTKSNTPPWVFFKFLKLYKWCQIVQYITYNKKEKKINITTTSIKLHFVRFSTFPLF